jgi:hypothetical protein
MTHGSLFPRAGIRTLASCTGMMVATFNDQLPIHEIIGAEPCIELDALVVNGNPGLPFKFSPCLFRLMAQPAFISGFQHARSGSVPGPEPSVHLDDPPGQLVQAAFRLASVLLRGSPCPPC